MRVVLLLLLILAAKVQAADPHSFSNFALVSHPQLSLDLTADFDKQQLFFYIHSNIFYFSVLPTQIQPHGNCSEFHLDQH